jgi:hypothetical protein
MLRKKKRVAVKVVAAVSAANGGLSTTYTRKASVKRQSLTRARR